MRHRFAWHANALAERFAEEASPEDWVRWSALDVPEVTELFGAMKGSARGSAGRLYLEDLWLGEPGSQGVETKLLDHNSIDRFTGGVRQQVLFREQVLMGTPFPPLHLRVERWSELSDITREAFRRALNDLVRGRLSLGAHAARGHGFVRWTGQMPFQAHWESANRKVEEARS